MDSVNVILSKALLEEKEKALKQMQMYRALFEKDNQTDALILKNILEEIKKIKNWR